MPPSPHRINRIPIGSLAQWFRARDCSFAQSSLGRVFDSRRNLISFCRFLQFFLFYFIFPPRFRSCNAINHSRYLLYYLLHSLPSSPTMAYLSLMAKCFGGTSRHNREERANSKRDGTLWQGKKPRKPPKRPRRLACSTK